MKKAITLVFLVCLTLISLTASSEVIQENTIYVKKVTILLKEKIRLPIAVDDKIIFSEIGNRPIRDLKRLDFFLDHQGRFQGIRILYLDRVSGLKSLYISKPKTIIFERPRKRTENNKVILRVLTTDEIINIW